MSAGASAADRAAESVRALQRYLDRTSVASLNGQAADVAMARLHKAGREILELRRRLSLAVSRGGRWVRDTGVDGATRSAAVLASDFRFYRTPDGLGWVWIPGSGGGE